jgi:hypothetical protein
MIVLSVFVAKCRINIYTTFNLQGDLTRKELTFFKQKIWFSFFSKMEVVTEVLSRCEIAEMDPVKLAVAIKNEANNYFKGKHTIN